MLAMQIAQICHDANRAYCRVIGDYSQKTWDEAEQWQRDSAIKGVEFALANPNIVPYQGLSLEQRVKDSLFKAIISACS